MLKILIRNINTIPDRDIFEEKMSLLSEERIQKIEKYKKWNDKRRSLLAGLLLKEAVEEYFAENGRDSEPFPEIAYGEYGKPYFPKEDLYFNLSHSGEYVLCVLSDSEVGCDIQELKPLKIDFSARFYSEKEKEFLAQRRREGAYETEEDYGQDVLRIFSAKESYMKYTGLGFKQELKDFTVDLRNGRIMDEKSGKAYSLILLKEAPNGYCATVVTNFDFIS